jgi:hypothetical protein
VAAIIVAMIVHETMFASHENECGPNWCSPVSGFTDHDLKRGPVLFFGTHVKTGTYLTAHLRYVLQEMGLTNSVQCDNWDGKAKGICSTFESLNPDYNGDINNVFDEYKLKPWSAAQSRYWKPSAVLRRRRYRSLETDLSIEGMRVVNFVRDPYHQLISAFLYLRKGHDHVLVHQFATGAQEILNNSARPINTKCDLAAEWFSDCLARLSPVDGLRVVFDWYEGSFGNIFGNMMRAHRTIQQSQGSMVEVCLEDLSQKDEGLRKAAFARILRFVLGDRAAGVDLDAFIKRLGSGEGHSTVVQETSADKGRADLLERDGRVDFFETPRQRKALLWEARRLDEDPFINGTLGRLAAELGCAGLPEAPDEGE